ncbi:MAG TPA: flagellar basal body-associated FliL family protein [Alphaproteobacteria bacterium]|jgi:flagellar FliL protein
MADTAADMESAVSSAGDDDSGKSGLKKIILIVVAALLVLGAIGAGLVFSGLFNPFAKKEADEAAKAESSLPPPKAAVFLDLPDLLVNLNSSNRRTNFLKISISLEVGSAEDVQKLQALMPRIVDSFQVYLRELRLEDLRGSAGMYRLREDLLRRINEAARPVKVNDVLFKELLVQ